MDDKHLKKSARANSSSKKFNTDLFSRPFTGGECNNNMNTSIHSQISNDVSFNKSINMSINNDKKRKPFDSINFKEKTVEEAAISQSNSSMKSGKKLNVSESLPKSNADTEITANNKKLLRNRNKDNANTNGELDASKLTDLDKSAMMRTQSAIDRETVYKAMKYNKANDKENCPFYIKFFLDETPQLNENSSYFKAENKELYLKTMLEVTRNDAKLEEANRKLLENKEKTANQLRLLLTEISNEKEVKKEAEKEKPVEETPNQIKSKKNINKVVKHYENIKKRDAQFDKMHEVNYHDYMKKLKESEEKKENFIQKNIKEVGENNLLNRFNHGKKMELNNEEIYKDEDPYPSLDQLDLEKNNYENIAFRYYGKDVLKSLMEIDKKLEKLNPAHNSFSTKNHLRDLKEKNTRSQMKAKAQAQKVPDKYSKQKLKKEDEYVNRNADPRFRKELRRELYNIDNQILSIHAKPISKEQIELFIEESNKKLYADPEQREKALDFKIPEETLFERMENKFQECDGMLKKIKIQIAEEEKREKENPKPTTNPVEEEPDPEEIENRMLLEKIYNDLEQEERKTKEMISGLDKVQDKFVEENNSIDKYLEQLQEAKKKNEIEYDKIYERYEKDIEDKYAKEEENELIEEGEKNLEDYYKQYGLDEIIHHDYNLDVESSRTKFKSEMENISEKMQILEKQLYSD